MTESTAKTAPPPETLPDLGYRYVTTPEELAECVQALEGTTVLAADIEGDSFFSYREKTCLIQITGDSGPDWVIDPLAIDDLSSLAPIMASKEIVKIFHGADYDVVSMKRDFGFEITPIFDTMIAAQATGHPRFGLNDLVQHYFGDTLNKKYQRHDWSARPFKPEHLEYARLDSHYLPRLREILQVQAAEAGREAMLAEEFLLLESREWTGRPFDPDDCLRIKGSNKLDETGKRVLRTLFVLRDSIASKKNRPAFKVWGNDAMLKLARTLPADRDQLTEALGSKSHLVRRYADDILAAIEAGKADTTRIPGRKSAEPDTRNLRVPAYVREDEPLFLELKNWRNARADEVELTPGMIVNNTVLKLIAALKPNAMEDYSLIDDMRAWQVNAYGEELLLRVRQFLESNPTPPPGADEEEGGKRRRRRRRRRRGGGEESAAAPTVSS